MRVFLVSLAVVLAVCTAGLVWGWGFWIFDDPAWRADYRAWEVLSIAAFAASFHPWAGAADVWIDRRHIR